MRPQAVDDFLRKARVPYTTFRHPLAFTAAQEAAASHVPGRCWGKTVICFADATPVMAVLPAHLSIDLDKLRALTGAATLRLAREDELAALYPECEPGAMPPLGGLYQQRVYVDTSLVGEPDMVFAAGTHTDAIRMHYGDFSDVSTPVVGAFAVRRPRLPSV